MQEIIKAAITSFGVKPQVNLINDQICDGVVYGEYTSGIDEINIYLPTLRTTRDFAFVLGHEFQHARQFNKMCRREDYLRYMKDVGYINNPLEIDADIHGFRFEDSLDYKTAILNPFVESIFIRRKELRNSS